MSPRSHRAIAVIEPSVEGPDGAEGDANSGEEATPLVGGTLTKKTRSFVVTARTASS
jgi:hypothetical protein